MFLYFIVYFIYLLVLCKGIGFCNLIKLLIIFFFLKYKIIGLRFNIMKKNLSFLLKLLIVLYYFCIIFCLVIINLLINLEFF